MKQAPDDSEEAWALYEDNYTTPGTETGHHDFYMRFPDPPRGHRREADGAQWEAPAAGGRIPFLASAFFEVTADS